MSKPTLNPSVSYGFTMRLAYFNRIGTFARIAGCIRPNELSSEYVVPSVFNREVVRCVAEAVQRVAVKSGVARKKS